MADINHAKNKFTGRTTVHNSVQQQPSRQSAGTEWRCIWC